MHDVITNSWTCFCAGNLQRRSAYTCLYNSRGLGLKKMGRGFVFNLPGGLLNKIILWQFFQDDE
jgi:hypothetical protein